MRYSSQVKPISHLTDNASEALVQLTEQRQPFAINEHGEAGALLQDVASLEEAKETLALLNVLALGRQDIAAGRLKPLEAVVARLRTVRSPD